MANTKLTLSLEKSIIEDAKKYAKGRNISLSQLIENYLLKLTSIGETKEKSGPLVSRISGVISLESDYDYRKDYTEYIEEKYQ